MDDLSAREDHDVQAPRQQPDPINIDGRDIVDLVLDDIAERARTGLKRYGVPLRAHNGRDQLWDAYEEALDLCQYLRAAIYERDGR